MYLLHYTYTLKEKYVLLRLANLFEQRVLQNKYSFTQIPTSLFLFLIDSGSHNGHWQLLQPLEFQRCYDRLPTPANEYTFYDYDGASRRSVSANTVNLHLTGVASQLRSCWRSGSFILWGSPLCWPDCCICTLVHQITRLELRPSPYCCWPSMRTAHDCDTIRMQHFHRNGASDKQEQDWLFLE